MPAEQAVVDDRGNGIAFLRAGSFLLNHGGHIHYIPHSKQVAVDIVLRFAIPAHQVGQVVVEGLNLSAHLLVKAMVEVGKHLVQHALWGVVLVEFIGVGEQEALQAVAVTPGNPIQEPIVIQFP